MAELNIDPAAFSKVPNTPFAYWVDDEIRDLFAKLPPFENEGRTVKQGLALEGLMTDLTRGIKRAFDRSSAGGTVGTVSANDYLNADTTWETITLTVDVLD
jgi:hypothetical protein